MNDLCIFRRVVPRALLLMSVSCTCFVPIWATNHCSSQSVSCHWYFMTISISSACNLVLCGARRTATSGHKKTFSTFGHPKPSNRQSKCNWLSCQAKKRTKTDSEGDWERETECEGESQSEKRVRQIGEENGRWQSFLCVQRFFLFRFHCVLRLVSIEN